MKTIVRLALVGALALAGAPAWAQAPPYLFPTQTLAMTSTSSTPVRVGTADASVASFSLSGTWTGTVAIQGSADNATWVTIETESANGSYIVQTTGYYAVRVAVSVVGTGTASVIAFKSNNATGSSGGGGGGGGPATQATTPWVDDITQWANTTLGAATAWGTAPSGNVPGVNANVLSLPTLPAGTNSIGAVTVTTGNVGGFISSQSVTPTVSTTAYVAGYEMGGLQTYASLIRSGQTTGLIQKVALQFNDSQTASTDAIFFNANPTNTTFTDHAALAIAAADVTKVIGVAHVNDCSSLGTPSLCQAQNLAIPIAASGSIYVVLVTQGAPTLASTSDLTVLISMVQN